MFPHETEMNKSSTKDKDNSLYTPWYETCPAFSQLPAGTALCTSSGLCQHGSQEVPPSHGTGSVGMSCGRRQNTGCAKEHCSTGEFVFHLALCPTESLFNPFWKKKQPPISLLYPSHDFKTLMFLLWRVRIVWQLKINWEIWPLIWEGACQ